MISGPFTIGFAGRCAAGPVASERGVFFGAVGPLVGYCRLVRVDLIGGFMSGVEHCQVSTTTDSHDLAATLARSAVEARVAACGQIVGPIESVYWWDGEVNTSAEWLVVFKTTTDQAGALVEHIRSNHTYDVPEVIVVPITGGNPAYLSWIDAETRQR